MADSRYGIGEWYGRPLLAMSGDERAQLADVALAEDISAAPNCPFRTPARPCSKHSGVCSLQKYAQDSDGDIIWMVVDLVPTDDGGHELTRSHWEVLTLERSCEKLLAAETIQRDAFLQVLRSKLSR